MVNHAPHKVYKPVLFGAATVAAKAPVALTGIKNFQRKEFAIPKGCIMSCITVMVRHTSVEKCGVLTSTQPEVFFNAPFFIEVKRIRAHDTGVMR